VYVVVSVIHTGIFPEPDKDPVIQIANMVIRQGEKDPFIRNVFTWKSCASIVGAEVLSFDTEQELLRVSNAVVCLSSACLKHKSCSFVYCVVLLHIPGELKEETCGSCHTVSLTSRVNSGWKTWRSEGI